jgi:hypothetical protein
MLTQAQPARLVNLHFIQQPSQAGTTQPQTGPGGTEHMGALQGTRAHLGALWELGLVWDSLPQTEPGGPEQVGVLSGDWEHYGAGMV